MQGEYNSVEHYEMCFWTDSMVNENPQKTVEVESYLFTMIEIQI